MQANISCQKTYNGKIYKISSELNSVDLTGQLLTEKKTWCSKKNINYNPEFIILEYTDKIDINFISIEKSISNNECFPENFRIEVSLDGQKWQKIHQEKGFILDESTYNIDIDLISIKFLKLFIDKPQKKSNKYYVEIGNITTGISGIKEFSVSNSISHEHSGVTLFDNNNSTYWETEQKNKPDRELIDIDLGKIYNVSCIELRSTKESPNGFPQSFTIEASPDKKIWIPLVDEKNFKAEDQHSYIWNLESAGARFFKIELNNVLFANNKYSLKLSNINIFASLTINDHIHQATDNSPHASTFQAGIIRLAKDGDDTYGSVVQAHDRRLKNASTLFKGIMQFAENGEENPGLAVQANDDRLKIATELKEGIVRLAYDRENKAGIAVQGNDSRLQEATDTSYGIVKFSPNGIPSEMGAVRGNDSRLREATTTNFGICKLAENGVQDSGLIVQADDSRLKDATTTSKGIVELADDGEDKEGVVVQGNDKRLKDSTTISKGIVELADDGEDKEGVVVQGNDKRLKNATTTARGIVELADDGEDKEGVVVQGNDKRLKKATLKTEGIMRFANNKEDSAFAAVQGNDQRLKDATTTSSGIVELAEDGEDREQVVVQGNDKRLKNATTTSTGIVELAEDGEDKEGVVVQGNDNRLKDSTTSTKGIVELAENGEEREGVVVQANDKRLKDATTKSKGIVQLAENGDNSTGVVVQGDDKRLQDATETHKGILEFAIDGGNKPFTAVQGNDKRIKDATTSSKGIVELAENGEDKPGVVVQGNDKRLYKATESDHGIVILAKDGESKKNTVVQSNDYRLSDARQPLDHEHDYAPINHDFNSHNGTITISDKKSEPFQGITPPSDNGSILYSKNQAKTAGNIAITGISEAPDNSSCNSYGILGHSNFIGIRGQSTGNEKDSPKEQGCGVLGISRFGAGGLFCSEHNYSLVVDGFGQIDNYDNSLKLIGNGQALSVNGTSKFNGSITLSPDTNSEKEFPANIVEMFEVDDEDYISAGDLLVASDNGQSILGRTHAAYDKAVIGVVSGNPAIILNNSGKEQKLYPVSLAGKVLCKVDARISPIKPGDLIVTSENPGCGMKGTIDSFDKIGTVIGKALDGLEKGIGVIPVFIIHS